MADNDLRRAARDFRAAAATAPREMQAVVRDSAGMIRREWVARTPRRSGRLAASIRVVSSGRTVQVVAGNPTVPYAWRARPAMWKAIRAEGKPMQDRLTAAADNVARRIEGR